MPRKKKSYQGAKLPAHIEEGIKQMYAVENNKAAVARAFNVNISTVYRVLKKEDPEVAREKRTEALGKLATKLSENALKLADDVAEIPENAAWGQKGIMLGIQVDKIEKLDKRLDEKRRLDQVDAGEVLALPEDVESIRGMLRNDLKEIAVFLGLKITTTGEEIEEEQLAQIVEAEVTKIADLDEWATDAQPEDRDDQSDGS